MAYVKQLMNGHSLTWFVVNKRLLRSRAGATTLEFALVAMPFFLLVFGTIEFGRVIWTQSAMEFAVQATARCVAVNETKCGTEAGWKDYAGSQLLASGIKTENFTLTTPACGKKVSISMPFDFLLADVMPARLTLTAMACHPVRA